MNTKNTFVLFLLFLGSLVMSSCSNEEDGFWGCKSKQIMPSNSIGKFKIEGNSIRINSPEDLPALKEILSMMHLNVNIATPNSGQITINEKKLETLERMAPSESGSESTGGLPVLTCSLFVRPVFLFKGDPNVYMETTVTIDGPSVYQKEGWNVTRNVATWKEKNTKVDYTVEGILYVKYQVTYKSPTTHQDTVAIQYLQKNIQESGTYVF